MARAVSVVVLTVRVVTQVLLGLIDHVARSLGTLRLDLVLGHLPDHAGDGDLRHVLVCDLSYSRSSSQLGRPRARDAGSPRDPAQRRRLSPAAESTTFEPAAMGASHVA